jgi:hypothetical protein
VIDKPDLKVFSTLIVLVFNLIIFTLELKKFNNLGYIPVAVLVLVHPSPKERKNN